MKIKTENIFQITELEVPVSKVYKTLLDSKRHTAFSGMATHIDGRVGGAFNTFDGAATGSILELVKDRRIVLSWRHRDFPEGLHTIIHIDLEKTESGVRLNFNHIGVPEASCGWLTESWRKTYWNRLKEFLEEEVLH